MVPQVVVLLAPPAVRPQGGVVLDLWAWIFQGRRLGKREDLISSDEKTSIQARCRCHPTPAPGKAQSIRQERDLPLSPSRRMMAT